MATSKKYYVVWSGLNPGIYEQWSACQAQIKGFPGARFKAFPSMEEARAAFEKGPAAMAPASKKNLSAAKRTPGGRYIPISICVDAACSGNPGPMEYQGVYTKSGETIFHQKYPMGTNNIGEFLAIVHALAYLKQRGQEEIPIYSDSVNALKWVHQKKCKTQLPETERTRTLYEVIRRAEKWLKENSYRNPLLKWETEQWGEIPADFGRK